MGAGLKYVAWDGDSVQEWPVAGERALVRGSGVAEQAAYPFFNHIARAHKRLLADHGSALNVCEALLRADIAMLSESAQAVFSGASRDLRNYLIASSYALLIGKQRRRQLSAYFTPPTLCGAALAAAGELSLGEKPLRVLDPACGGGAFLVPMARQLIAREMARGTRPVIAVRRVLSRLQGVEIDAGLAVLSRSLLRDLIEVEIGVEGVIDDYDVVQQADALEHALPRDVDLVIGNPPYGRVGDRVSKEVVRRAGRAGLGGHTNFYALFLLRALDCLRTGGRLVFILPTSFVAGPYFAGLRREVLERARVVRLDVHHERENLFVGAVQDVCLIVLERRSEPALLTEEEYEAGLIDAAGVRRIAGRVKISVTGEPWSLPVERVGLRQPQSVGRKKSGQCVLADYGYRVRVGKVVPTRERERLRDKCEKGAVPLLWASAVRPDGSFAAKGGAHSRNPGWFVAGGELLPYATRGQCVLVQRTSNRDQQRRLNAAAVPTKFLKRHRGRGFVAENHVIILEAVNKKRRVPPSLLAAVLNSRVVNERFATVSGSFSVSAKLLERLILPAPQALPKKGAADFEARLRGAFSGFDGVLAACSANGTKDSVDET